MSYYKYSLKFIPDLSTVKSGGLRPLYAQLIVNSKKALISLHEFVDGGRWSYETGRIIKPKNKYEEYLNNKLNRIDNQLNAIRLRLEADNEEVTAKKIKDVFQGRDISKKITLLDFFAIVIQELIAKNEHSPPVLVHYKQARTKLESYLASIGAQELLLEQFSGKHVVGFETYLLSTKVKVLNRSLGRNTANNILKKTKAVIHHAMRRELIKSNPFSDFKMHAVQTNRTSLTSAELSALENYDFSSKATMQKVKDIFLFSAYCGVRFSDSMALKEENLVKDATDGRIFLNIVQQKTKTPMLVPLLNPALEILNKYAENRKQTGYALPKISNQKCNSYLREMAGIVGIKTKMTHHVARHTYATIVLLDNGVDIKSVSDMMGHYSVKSTEGYSKTTKKKLLKVAESVEAEISKNRQESGNKAS
jgi:integrase/recombinase XerD